MAEQPNEIACHRRWMCAHRDTATNI